AILFSCNSFGKDKPIGEIPFTINEKGLMQIELFINKKKVSKFILDTGASSTVIDDDTAQEMNLNLQEGTFKSTWANSVTNDGRKTDKQQITITEKVQLKGIELNVRDLSHLGDMNGIIGFDLFRKFVSHINFDSQKIMFYEQKGRPDTKGYQAIKFTESFCTPEVKVTFSLENGEAFSGKAFFDTGNTAYPLIINATYQRKNGLPSKFKSLSRSGSKNHSKVQMDVGTIQLLTLGKFELGEMPTALSNTETGVLSWEGYLGLIGLEYISKFNVIIDYHRKKLFLKPNNSFSEAFTFP
ncbi:MAG: retropepsin-like aspartic protease, partial [Bacteroidota bacterium]